MSRLAVGCAVLSAVLMVLALHALFAIDAWLGCSLVAAAVLIAFAPLLFVAPAPDDAEDPRR